MANSRKIITPVGRASFVHVFQPRTNDSGKLEYTMSMIFDKDTDISELKALVKEAIMEKWGNKPPKNLKFPIKKGNDMDTDKYPEYKNKIVINTKSVNFPPGVINRKNQPIIDPNEFYSGAYCVASLVAYSFEHKTGGKGVAFGLQNIMKIKDGEPLISRGKAEDDFASIINGEVDIDLEDDDEEDDDILGDLG